MKKIFRNKLGQADILGNILTTIPKPLIFIFFIVILSVITALLSPVFNAFGVYCESDGTVVKVHDANIIDQFSLIRNLPDASEIAGDSIDPDKYWFDIAQCTKFYDGSQRFLSYGQCHSCTEYSDEVEDLMGVDYKADVCIGDAFRSDDDDMNWWNRKVFCPTLDCRIPKGYYFEFDTGQYQCLVDCGSQTLANIRDEKLSELGAMPLYPGEVDSMRFEGIFKFGCSDTLKVEPTIKGVPLFRLEYWAIIILIILMFWALKNFGKK